MGFMEAVKKCLREWVTFSGRAPRSEYWWFTLFNVIFSLVVQLLMGAVGVGASGGSASIGIVVIVLAVVLVVLLIYFGIAGISVTVRRLHDKDRSGWWYWIVLVPIVGIILLLVWFCQRGTSGPNRFGNDPLGGVSPEVFE